MMPRHLLPAIGLVAALALPGAGAAQTAPDGQTLADIRQELSTLFIDLQGLRRELSTTGLPGTVIGGNTPLERLNAIESELQRLTSKTEALENRVNRITVDGTNRIGDLEFRICEVEPGCDIGSLGSTPSLGGVDSAANVPVAAPPPASGGPALAIGEQADFERAQGALASRDFRGAADQFAAFVQTYPGGPLSPAAHLGRGEALEELGQTSDAARAYLDSFSGDPTGQNAPQALVRLGVALGKLGQTQDACLTLAEVGTRFPGSDAMFEAQLARQNLGCQ